MAPCESVDERVTAHSAADAPSDRQLITAINGCDAAAFEILYFRYREWLIGLAFRFTGGQKPLTSFCVVFRSCWIMIVIQMARIEALTRGTLAKAILTVAVTEPISAKVARGRYK